MVLEEFAWIYQSCAQAFRWTPQQVDQMEVWEVATVLEALVPPAERAKRRPSRGGSTSPHLTGRDLLAARVRHAKGQGPKPEAAPMRPDEPVLGRLS